jgi:hypothetical protein
MASGESEVRSGPGSGRELCEHVFDTEESGAVMVEARDGELVVATRLGK